MLKKLSAQALSYGHPTEDIDGVILFAFAILKYARDVYWNPLSLWRIRLIDEGDYLLFVEKIAFEQPYQVTKFNNVDELVAMLSARPEYTAEEGKEPSVICQNDKVIGKIEANNTAA